MNTVPSHNVNFTPAPLEALIQELPTDLRLEVRNFIESLLAKRTRAPHQSLRQDWAGSLKQYREQYTSVDLQHQALAWRGD